MNDLSMDNARRYARRVVEDKFGQKIDEREVSRLAEQIIESMNEEKLNIENSSESLARNDERNGK